MSLELLNAFKFVKKDAFLHNLDPRTKLLLSIVYTVSALLFTNIIPLLFIFLSLIPLILLGRLVKQWLKSFRSLSYLFIVIILLNTLFMNENGFSFSIGAILRVLIMISAFSIFFLTVDPNDLALSLISMKVPYEYAFSLSLAFRFVPTIAMEAQHILDAQQSRGYEMQKKGILNQIKNLFPLLVPLIICSIKRAFNVAEALESRAFGSKKERSFYFIIRYSIKDWLFTFYLLIFFIISLILSILIRFGNMPKWFIWSLPI